MDNPSSLFTEFFLRRGPRTETLTITPIRNRSRTLFFIRHDSAKGVAVLFLNCTKNTELTRGGFALTFSFALTKKKAERPSRESRFEDNQNTTATRFFSGQRAMKSLEWKTYRTRFLVKAKQLSSSLSFTDHLGRQHCGRKGDYLVESFEGVLSIAPRQIFEDIYVPMGLAPDSSETQPENATGTQQDFRFEPLRIEKIKTDFRDDDRSEASEKLPRARKSPQPVRVSASRLSLM